MAAFALLLGFTMPLHAEQPVGGLRAPEGFEVTQFAGDDLAHDIYSMTINARGEVVVSGVGYVRALLDTDGDGTADATRQFADGPGTGAQGMHFDGPDLICTGDAGLIRYRDADGDGQADGPPETLLKMKTGGEHHAHAVRKGPDGWWYVIAGNFAEIDESYVTLPTSPIKKPHGGVILRIKPDFSGSEVVCHGYRNPYDFDFHPSGAIFTYDSDGERFVSLPWYRPTRVFQALPGSHAGWVSRHWKRPDYYPDMPPVIGSFGRGSPTGVECYRHFQFPEVYQDAIFIADWSYGRIIALPLERGDGGFQCEKPIDFLTATGDFGFAPTDLCVAPDGSLFVSVGGRGTKGGVYRVRWKDANPWTWPEPKADKEKLLAIASAPQPLSSWSRAKWEPWAKSFTKNDFLAVMDDPELSEAERIRIVAEQLRIMGAMPRVFGTANPSAGFADPTWEPAAKFPLWLTHADTFFENMSIDPLSEFDSDTPHDDALRAIRLFQLGLGGMGPNPDRPHPPTFDGYTARLDWKNAGLQTDLWTDKLTAAFPHRDDIVTHEIARLMAILEFDRPDAFEKVLDRITADSDPVEDVHYLICTARMPVERTEAQRERIAAALVELESKIVARKLVIDLHWGDGVGEMYAAHVQLDPMLPAAVARHERFGSPSHVLFLKGMSAESRREALAAFVRRIEAEPDYAWSPEIVALLAESGEQRHRELLRGQFDNYSVRAAVLRALAKRPEPRDRGRFLAGLESAEPAVITASLAALEKLGPDESAAEQFALLKLARRLGADRPEYELRERVMKLLGRSTGTGDEFGFVTGKAGHNPQREALGRWEAHLRERWPEEARTLLADAEIDLKSFEPLLVQSAELEGDALRGQRVFEKRACAQCHGGVRAVGPDLAGVTKRFSRDDLFTAILAPDRDVSPRYATTTIITTEGKSYTGLVIYESVDGLLLRDGTGETLRIERDQIERRRQLTKSLMPAGLLKDTAPRDLADLYAYLKTLGS
jgi:putative membrane-bound dehydrogenase-like protein